MSLARVDKRGSAKTRKVAARLRDRLLYGELDLKVAKAYPDGGWDAYQAAIERFGNPADQIERYHRARIILQPKQLEFAAWARRLDHAVALDGELGAPELGMGGAKGPGKSFALFAQASVDDCQRFDGLKVLYLRKTGLRAQEQMHDLLLAVLGHLPYQAVQGEVRFPNGSKIIVGHFQTEKEALNYAGIEYDVIIIEETTTLTERAYKALRQSARTSKPWRPRVYNSTNPLGIGHKFYKLRFIDHERKHAAIEDRTRKFIFATVDDNRFVNPDYRGNLEDLSGPERRAYLAGDWDVSAGAFFDQWRHDVHVIAPIQPLRAWPVWASMDYGFNHWNVILLHTRDGDGTIYTFDELATRKRYPEEIVPTLREMLSGYDLRLADVERFYAGADVFAKTGATRDSVEEQYKKLGIKLLAAETSPGSRVGGARRLAQLLGVVDPTAKEYRPPRWYVTERCSKLIGTLPYLEVDPNEPEDVKKVDADSNGEGGDDAYDAARYGIFVKERKPYGTEAWNYA